MGHLPRVRMYQHSTPVDVACKDSEMLGGMCCETLVLQQGRIFPAGLKNSDPSRDYDRCFQHVPASFLHTPMILKGCFCSQQPHHPYQHHCHIHHHQISSGSISIITEVEVATTSGVVSSLGLSRIKNSTARAVSSCPKYLHDDSRKHQPWFVLRRA